MCYFEKTQFFIKKNNVFFVGFRMAIGLYIVALSVFCIMVIKDKGNETKKSI